MPRLIEPDPTKAARHFPALIITVPRRAGKTTLLRRSFPEADCRLLADPESVSRVRNDSGVGTCGDSSSVLDSRGVPEAAGPWP